MRPTGERGARRLDGPVQVLTGRERDVLALMAEGRSNPGIAAQLTLSVATVECHVSSIFAKLGLHRAQHDHRRVLAVLAALEQAG